MNDKTWPNFPDIQAGKNVSLGKTTYFGDKRLAVFVIGDPAEELDYSLPAQLIGHESQLRVLRHPEPSGSAPVGDRPGHLQADRAQCLFRFLHIPGSRVYPGSCAIYGDFGLFSHLKQ